MVSSSISFQLVCVTRFTTDPDVNKRREEEEEEENKSVQQKRILKGREETEKKNPLCVRSKSLGTKNDLSYSRSSDLRIDTGRVKKKTKNV